MQAQGGSGSMEMCPFSARVKPRTKAISHSFMFLYHLLSALSLLYTLNPHITQVGLDEIGPSELDRKERPWSRCQSFGL